MGALTTMYDGNRPTGYNPMKKQGAIILGIGGDNTADAQGNFFEGVLTVRRSIRRNNRRRPGKHRRGGLWNVRELGHASIEEARDWF